MKIDVVFILIIPSRKQANFTRAFDQIINPSPSTLRHLTVNALLTLKFHKLLYTTRVKIMNLQEETCKSVETTREQRVCR